MKKKLFLLPLLMCGMMGLTFCTIFNDDDIKHFKKSFNKKVIIDRVKAL